MPVTVHLWEGRSVAQKRALARAITDAMVEFADGSRDGMHVWIEEYPLESWARNGVLAIDMDGHVAPADRPPAVWRLDHALLETSDLDAAEAFYTELLGFAVRKRDRLADGRPLVVTEQGLGLTTGRTAPDGSVRTLAFRGRNLAAIGRVLDAAGVEYELVDAAAGPVLRFADVDGNRIELTALN
jgi:4-oxalocrotonate tautomerase